jgi:transposase
MTFAGTISDRDGALEVFLFETTTDVFWAEEVAQEAGIPVEVIPAPPPRGDLCGTALRTTGGLAHRLERVLRDAGIPFHAGEAGHQPGHPASG